MLKRVMCFAAAFVITTNALGCSVFAKRNNSSGKVQLTDDVSEVAENYVDGTIDLLNRSIVLRVNSPLSYVFGEKRFIDDLDHSFVPVIENGRVLLPVRFLSDVLGGKTEWNNDTMTATITYDDRVIEIQLGNKYMEIDGDIVELDAAARSEGGRTVLPARAIAEALGKEVYYNNGFIVIGDKDLKIDETHDEVINIINLVQNELIGVNKADDDEMYFNGKRLTTYYCVDGADIPLECPRNKCIIASSGIYAENVSLSEADNNCVRVVMDVYNTMASYGVIEVYDANGNLLPEKTVQLGKLEGSPTSMQGCVEKFWPSTYGFGVAIGGLILGDDTELMYRNPVSGYHTPVDITVPLGGAILITNDMKQSKYVAAYNIVDLAIESFDLGKAALGLSGQKLDSFKKVLKKKLAEEIVKEGIKNEQFINTVVADYSIKDLKSHIESQVNTAIGILKNPDIDLQGIISQSLGEIGVSASLGVAEEVFKKMTGPIGVGIDSIFLMSSTSNFIKFLTDMDKTQNGNACVLEMPETIGVSDINVNTTFSAPIGEVNGTIYCSRKAKILNRDDNGSYEIEKRVDPINAGKYEMVDMIPPTCKQLPVEPEHMGQISSFCYYGGYVYYVESRGNGINFSSWLYRCKPDWTGNELLDEVICDWSNPSTSGIRFFYIDNGVLYCDGHGSKGEVTAINLSTMEKYTTKAPEYTVYDNGVTHSDSDIYPRYNIVIYNDIKYFTDENQNLYRQENDNKVLLASNAYLNGGYTDDYLYYTEYCTGIGIVAKLYRIPLGGGEKEYIASTLPAGGGGPFFCY